MQFLLPHRFKKIGAVIAPVGFFIWLSMQLGYVTRILIFMVGANTAEQYSAAISIATITIAFISFFSFLGGVYFVTFSKEKVEDEMVARTRLDSFQLAALVQLISMIVGFLSMIIIKEPDESGWLLFFIGTIFLFWIFFIGRFNYILHIRIRE